MPDPNKYQKEDQVKNLFKHAVDTVSAPRSMVNNPGIAFAGLGVGAAKNFTDLAALPAAGLQQIGNYISGKGAVKDEDNIYKKYEDFSQNLTIDIGTLGNRDKLNDTQLQEAKKAAAGSQFLGSFLGMHGASKVPITKGGVAGVAGELLTKANIGKSSIVSGISKIIPDEVFKGAAGVQATGKKMLKPNSFTSEIASVINPKTATNIVAGKAPEAFLALSERYDMPIAKIRDVGDSIFNKFINEKEISKKKFGSSLDVDTFVDNEMKSMPGLKNIDPEAEIILRHELVDTLKERHAEFGETAEAKTRFTDIVDRYKSTERIRKELQDPNTPITDVERAKRLNEVYKQIEYKPGELERLGKKLKKVSEDEYIKNALDPDNTVSLETLQENLIKEHSNIYEQIKSVDPEAAINFDRKATQTFVGKIGQLGNLFKAEPVFGDFNQVNEALPLALIKNAEKLNVDPNIVASHKTGFGEWYKSPKIKDTIVKTIIDPNRTQFDSIYQSTRVGKTTPNNVVDKIFEHVADVGMSNQIQFRQRLIENVILPEAYAQVKAYGIPEGSPKFNQAVINNTKHLIEESGMIPPELSKVVYTEGSGKVVGKTGSFSGATTGMMEEAKKHGQFGRELAGASTFMLKWVKGATQAKLKAWNTLNESLDQISKTSRVTETQKKLITNSVVDLVAGTILFGGRGMRLPGLITEEMSNAINTKEAPENLSSYITGAIATWLKINPEQTRELKDGLFYKMTGLSSGRTSNMPLPALGAGNEIFSSIAMKKFGPLIGNIIGNVHDLPNYLSSGAFATDMVNMFTSQDTEIASDVGSEGKRFDSKGNPIDIDVEKHPLAHAPGVDFTKNLPSKDTDLGGVDYGQAPKNILNRYKRLSDSEALNKENLKGLAMELKEVYKGDPKKVRTALKSIIRDRLVPKGGEIFQDLAGIATSYNSLGNKEILEKEPSIQRLSKEQVVEQAALSALTQKGSYGVLKLLISSGKLDVHDPEDKKLVREKIREIQKKIKGIKK